MDLRPGRSRWRTGGLPPLLLALAVACLVTAIRAAFQTATLQGTVRDALSSLPIPGAEVQVSGTPVPVQEGVFQVHLPPGQWVLWAQAPGFAPLEIPLDTRIAHPRRLQKDLALSPLELTVHVRDGERGVPLAGARALAAGQPCTTDATGRCRWLRLQGAVALRAEAEGFLPADLRLSPEEVRRHQESHNPLEVWLQPLCLTLCVQDPQGAPVPGARATAGSQEVQADADGRITFCRAPGALEVQVQAEGFLPWRGAWQAPSEGAPPPLEVVLAPRRTPGRVLSKGPREEPIAEARVRIGPQEIRTGPDGTFVLERLRPGDQGQVEADGYEPLVWTYAGQERLEFRLTPLPTVVQVLDLLSGEPVRGAWVGALVGEAQADSTGQAILLGVAPGEEVRVRAEGYLPAAIPTPPDRHVVLRLLPQVVEGTVLDAETGLPIPRARLYTPAGLVRADEQGRYRLAGYEAPPTVLILAAGYRKTAFRLDPEALAEALRAPGASAGVTVRPTPSGGRAELDFFLQPHVVHALYIPLGRLSDRAAVQDLLRLAAESDLNGVVVDVKGDKGRLAFRPRNAIAQEAGAFRTDLMDLEELLAFCREHGLYTVARMVVFKDPVLAEARPEWALHRPDGSLWLDRSGMAWVNPYLSDVWDYNLALAREVADLGFDEIQLDYIRFPSDGEVGAVDYGQESTRETRIAAIQGFMRAFARALEDKPVFTGVDVFGLTVTVHPESEMGIGQRVMDVAPYVDYLCPMVYPSTFAPGNLGLADPYASPYEVVYRSVQEASRRVPPGTRVRPWLQYYFYGPDDLRQQMQAAADAGGWGWMFWNSRANYFYPQVFTFHTGD
ncbi:MAG: putative glycoside hydrolase [Anaerolineae bacterium]